MLALPYDLPLSTFNSLDITKKIFAQLERSYSGSTLARIAVEVLGVDEPKLLVRKVVSGEKNEFSLSCKEV